MVRHAHRLDERIDRKDEVQQDELEDRGVEGQPRHLVGVQHILVWIKVDAVMDFLGSLPDKEKSARDQYDVTPREPVAEQLEQRFRQRDDERDQRQKAKPHPDRKRDWEGKSVSVRVDICGRRLINKTIKININQAQKTKKNST